MKKYLILIFFLLHMNSFGQKIFNQHMAKGKWQYIYPFVAKEYVLAIQYNINPDGSALTESNTNLYFGKSGGKTDQLFWKENLFMQVVKNNFKYEDYNNDGIKDLLLFITTGSRGSNEHYNLYLINQKFKRLTKVDGFDEITNPSYNKKNKVIIGYGFSGTNNYSLYSIDKNNKIYQIGEGFEDTDELDLDQKIAETLKKNNK